MNPIFEHYEVHTLGLLKTVFIRNDCGVPIDASFNSVSLYSTLRTPTNQLVVF